MTAVARRNRTGLPGANNGLSTADYTVLTVLSGATGGRLRAFHLGAMMGWEKSRLHHQLTRMSKRGLVERHSGEARAVHVTLIQKGHEALTEAAPSTVTTSAGCSSTASALSSSINWPGISATVLANLQRPDNAADSCTDEN
ncbi:DNA-binding MarR family transcriptional regulator [Kibdelosporangium banguiense]|uniref:DNA-binding MarR family transcriptional regulator n=1 Tax=Kibdelosporangium banguiense TaxID=1365924 RepID=A0ABS4TYC6_9PSEU|nr:MarR family winged helix-turn-helix transcriptional regulator [Kibdelosporangium banguiense]MBP2328955.1 DNA-binding MarR family transcriptional regulator [Kibdelosporangium banguiense]